MKGLLHPEAIQSMPTMAAWLAHAEATRWIARQKYAEHPDDALLNVTIQENVLIQMENLRTHPAVAAGLAAGKLKLHGWVYKIETGQIFAYDPERGQFVPLTEVPPAPVPPSARLTAARSI
jgi:carbonic anhydrase